MKLINDWLQGKRSFTYGTILYNRFGADQELKQLFEKGKTDYTEKKLLECLTQLAGDDQDTDRDGQQLPADLPEVQNVGGGHEWPEEKKDKILMALRAQWMPFFTEMNYKRHQLDIYMDRKSDAAMLKRGALAFEILALEQKCIDIWQKRDYYLRFGKLQNEGEKAEPVIDPGKLGERYIKVQAYIRGYKFQLRKDATNEKNIALLKKYEEELEFIKQRL